MKNKKTTASLIALLLLMCNLVGVLISCDSTQATSDRYEYSTITKYQVDWEDPPEISTLAPVHGTPIIDDKEEDKQPEKTVRYAASSESDKFHYLSCHYVDRIKSYNIVYYYTASEARSDGKSPCSVCNP